MSSNIPKKLGVKIISITSGQNLYGLGDDEKVYKYIHRYGGDTGKNYDDWFYEWVEVRL